MIPIDLGQDIQRQNFRNIGLGYDYRHFSMDYCLLHVQSTSMHAILTQLDGLRAHSRPMHRHETIGSR